MLPTRQGSLRLFRLFGIDVYLHWSWFLIAIFKIQDPTHQYSSPGWSWLEYLTLFLIVLLHEFGHALACRQVGGQANQIVLWPLGGIAYVAPPPRPGPMLWSIAAGPLVNVALFPIFTVLLAWTQSAGWPEAMPDVSMFVLWIWRINTVLLMFNLLPLYPLDGGQILRSLLWFVFGRARSLMIATIIGFIGMAALIPFIIKANYLWFYILAAFVLLNLWQGARQSHVLFRLARLPRRHGFACPDCKTAPPVGEFWICGKCRKGFDTFETQGVCPHCGTQYTTTACLDCGRPNPMREWTVPQTDVRPRLA